jgi:predicted transposase YbfD/YdcC
MNKLHAFLENYANDLQVLLAQHQDEGELIKGIKEKWQDENDLRRAFVMACREEMERLEDEAGDETGEKRVNVLNGRVE